MTEEVFKDIQGYEGSYQATSFGRIYSVISKKFLKSTVQKNGYLLLGLYKNKVCKKHTVHRLIALTFNPNPENKPDVNHDDGVKSNCVPSNLIWATKSENSKHACDTGLSKPPVMTGASHPFYGKKTHLFGKKGKEHPRFGRPGAEAKIILDTQTGIFYDSIREAADAKGLNRMTLSDKLLGKIKKNNTSLIYA